MLISMWCHLGFSDVCVNYQGNSRHVSDCIKYLVQSKLVDPCPDLLCHSGVRLDLLFGDCTHTHTQCQQRLFMVMHRCNRQTQSDPPPPPPPHTHTHTHTLQSRLTPVTCTHPTNHTESQLPTAETFLPDVDVIV